MTYKAVIIGTGSIARAHVEAVRANSERIQIVAAMNRTPERLHTFCQEQGIAHAYTNLEAMLAEHRPDVALICSSPNVHRDQIIRCLEAGAWVLCEKPLVASLAELDEVQEAEGRTGRYVSSIFQLRFGSGAQHVKRLVDSGELGRALLGLAHTLWFRDDAYYAVDWRGKWATETGGTVMAHGIHQMDLALWLLGDWAEVKAYVTTANHAIEVEDLAVGVARMANGALLNVISSAVSSQQNSHVRLDFTQATVEARYLYSGGFNNDAWSYTLSPGIADTGRLDRWQAMGENIPATQAAQLTGFLDSMDRGDRPQVSGEDARRTLEFVTALYKSAFTGQAVQRGEIGPGDPFYSAMNGGMALGQ